MPQLVPVDFDPWAERSDADTADEAPMASENRRPRLVAVDHDPYADASQEEDSNLDRSGLKSRLVPVDHDPFAGSTAESKGEDPGLVGAILDSFKQAGEDLATGYQASASEFYNTGANALMLINRAADYLTEKTGVGSMSRDTAFGHIEGFLRDAAKQVAPQPEDMPQDTAGKIYQGLGSAPVAIGEYVAGIKALGPVLGFAGIDALREADKGVEAAAEAGAKGALMGKVFQAAEPLTRPLKAAALGTTGAIQAAAEGGDASDIVAGGAVMGTLGALGGKGEVGLRELTSPRPSLDKVKATYRQEPTLTEVEGNPFEDIPARDVIQAAPATATPRPSTNGPESIPTPSPETNAALTPSVEPFGKTTFIVKGDRAAIQAKLAEAGITVKGLFNKKQNGLIFANKHEAAIKDAFAQPDVTGGKAVSLDDVTRNTVPENKLDIAGQIEAMQRGERGPVFVQTRKEVPPGVAYDKSAHGGYWLTPMGNRGGEMRRNIAEIETTAPSADTARQQILGYQFSKADVAAAGEQPVAVVTTDAQGRRIKEQMVPASQAEAVATTEQAARPNLTVATENPVETIAHREAQPGEPVAAQPEIVRPVLPETAPKPGTASTITPDILPDTKPLEPAPAKAEAVDIAKDSTAEVTRAKQALDAAGVTGVDRTSTIAAVRRGELTADDVTESHKIFKAGENAPAITEPHTAKPAASETVAPDAAAQSGTPQAHWIEPTATPEAFSIETLRDKSLIVRGDASTIRARLAAAGVKAKGLPNNKEGGLMFPKKHEAELRSALEMPASGADARNAWSPGSNYVGMINDSTLPAGAEAKASATPLRREDVLRPFLKALNVPLYEGRVKGNRLGFYLPKKEAVRVKSKSDLEVASHELAHLIDDRVTDIRKSWLTGPKAKTYREELKGLSYDQGKIYEGFAEFTRLYMTQPEKAAQLAPEYSKWWGSFVDSHQYGPAIKQARDGMTAWFNQDALTRAASKIGPQKKLNEVMDGAFDKFRQSVADDLHGIYRMEKDLSGKTAPVGPYETARLTRASHSIVEGALTIGAPKVQPDGSHTFTGKGLKQILDPVSDNIDNFTLYAVGRSARELMMQGREKLFTRAEISSMVSLETPALRKAFNEYQEWNKAVVDFAETKGLIDPETRKLWKRTQYLPFYRAGESAPTGKGKTEGEWKGIHKLTGGTANINDVLGNMIQNANMLITEALRNEARVKVADMADQVKGGGRFMVKIPRDTKSMKVDKEQVQQFVYKLLGVDAAQVRAGMVPAEMQQAITQMEQAFMEKPEYVKFWLHGQSPKGDNVVAVMRNGTPEFYEVADPLLYRAVSSLNRPAKHWTAKVLNGFRRVGQSSITLTPDFMAANMARDTLMGGIISRHGFTPFVDSIRGMKSRIAKDASYREFIANGGGFSSHLTDEAAFRKHLERFYTKKGIDYRTVIDSPSKALYALESITDAFEMSTRLGEYQRARKAGEHPRHAAYSAREVSTDFAMRGDSKTLGFMYDSVMFLKAGVNGMDRLYRGVAHDPNKAQIAAKTGILALMSMGLYALNRDNPLYDQLEDWDKDTNWHFFIPKTGTNDDTPLAERYHHFRYPKIWEIGAVASVSERSMEQLLNTLGNGNADEKKLAGDVLRVTTDLFKFDYVPHAFAPLYEQALNKNRFTDRPIETQEMQSLAPYARAKPYGSRALKDLGLATRDMPRELQVRPARAEALLRGYFNTWAMYGLTLADAALYDDKPDMRVDEYPVLRRFYAAEPARHTKHETMFYDMLREATELRRTMRYMDKMNRPDIGDEIENKPEVVEYNQLDRMSEQLQAINREIKMVYSDETLSGEQKRKKLDELTREKNEKLKAVVEDIGQQRQEQAK